MSADRLRQRNDPCGRVSKNLDPIQRIVYNRCPLWDGGIGPWCNWQHAWLWTRRVQVRTLAGQSRMQKGSALALAFLFGPGEGRPGTAGGVAEWLKAAPC